MAICSMIGARLWQHPLVSPVGLAAERIAVNVLNSGFFNGKWLTRKSRHLAHQRKQVVRFYAIALRYLRDTGTGFSLSAASL